MTKKNQAADVSVYLIDDHEVVRHGLRDILIRYGIQVVGEAASAAAFLETGSTMGADCLVVDLNLGQDSGLALIERLRAMRVSTPILVYSMHEVSHIQVISAVYRAGAQGFVTKASRPAVLAAAIREVTAGHTYFMEGVAENLALYHTRGDEADPRNRLSAKELELFTLLAAGKKPEDAAELLGLSLKSVLNRVVEIRRKLDCSRADFTSIALRYNLITLGG